MHLPDCLSGQPYTPEACERHTVREMNAGAPRCDKGHATTYNHGVGAFRCEGSALVRGNGSVVRPCSL